MRHVLERAAAAGPRAGAVVVVAAAGALVARAYGHLHVVLRIGRLIVGAVVRGTCPHAPQRVNQKATAAAAPAHHGAPVRHGAPARHALLGRDSRARGPLRQQTQVRARARTRRE